MLLLSCASTGTTATASSVLNKNAKLYGPMNALDTKNESSCWNSDGQADGEIENSFVVNFHRKVLVEEIRIQFQGGFACEECTLYSSSENNEWKEIDNADIEPENINSIQSFPLGEDVDQEDRLCNAVQIGFHSMSDFYGRVIIYKLEVWGEEQK